ncbi:beta-1,3-galactosyltransferase [Tritrichomonas foetus]|uniref:Beta-1,3-galactosyltransferase n=1 Tax=Tritrichomonas foetus TaxID=1144522 RepID=A0A1J4J5I0_9EUKA|nr:beta-1,3-galactosyltransferase [Tritrichomonas foetus]|eukprot:OHS92717.1 beta-1,3-galactosyltransferase [Tritrichomonas foetus]
MKFSSIWFHNFFKQLNMNSEHPRNTKSPFFSFIIPVFNKVNFVENFMNCLLNQSFQNFEIIIIDDLSIDGSFEKLIQYKKVDQRITIIRNCVNRGLAVTRSHGVLESHGDYIFSYDPDDEITLNAAELVRKELIHYHYPDILEFRCVKFFFNGKIEYNAHPCYRSFHNNLFLTEAFRKKQIFYTIWKRVIKRSIYLKAVSLIIPLTKEKRMNYAEDKVHTVCNYILSQQMICSPISIYKYYFYSNNSQSNLYQSFSQNMLQERLSQHISDFVLQHKQYLFQIENLLQTFLNSSQEYYINYLNVTNVTNSKRYFICQSPRDDLGYCIFR